MTHDEVPAEECLRRLDALLVEPHVVLVAIATDGRLVPMPTSVPVPAQRSLQLPAGRATMLDVVVEDDVMPVVSAWLKALSGGAGSGTVRTRQAPLAGRSLTFLDVREQHGVLIGALGEQLAGDLERPREVTVSWRPRTALLELNTGGVITSAEERLTGMLGWTVEHAVGRNLLDFIHPDDQSRSVMSWIELITHGIAQRVRVRQSRADGSWAWLELESTYHAAEVAEDSLVVTQLNDVSEEMAAQLRVQQQEQLLRRVAESMPVGIAQLKTDGELVYANARLRALLDVPQVDGLADVLAAFSPDDAAAVQRAIAATGDGAGTTLEVWLADTGRCAAVHVTALSSREGAPGSLLCVTDVTDSVRLREELTAKATFDLLTGCHNRGSTMTVLDRALRPADSRTAVVFLDLDHFKPINDEHGHAVGDQVLVATASRLAGVLRGGDVLGRIGGDEFLVIGQGVAGPADALVLAQRLRDSLREPLVLTAGTVALSASIGVACAEPGVSAVDLIKRADAAMYECKQQRLGVPVLYRGA